MFTNQQIISKALVSSVARAATRSAPALVFNTTIKQNEITIRTTPKTVRSLLTFLRNSELFQMTSLVDIQTTDRLETTGRFVVKYALLSTKLNQRCTVELCVDELTPIPSVACPFFNNQRIFASAG
jgi:NADH:ubiquinone oxidoreductase subunit C